MAESSTFNLKNNFTLLLLENQLKKSQLYDLNLNWNLFNNIIIIG